MVAGDKLEIEPIIFISVTVCYRLHCQEVSPARSQSPWELSAHRLFAAWKLLMGLKVRVWWKNSQRVGI